jgi:glycosidase
VALSLPASLCREKRRMILRIKYFNLLIIFGLALLFPGCGQKNPLPSTIKNSGNESMSFWKDAIFYSVFVDRFFDSKTGDGKFRDEKEIWKFQGGDLQGLRSKIPYLKELGITAIVLNPITDGTSYHGYHPVSHFSVNPELGTLSDFHELVTTAHENGMRIIFDLVANHVSPQSPLVTEHPDWFRNPAQDGNFRINMDYRERYKATFFSLPDFKQENEEVYHYLIKFARFWVHQGIDGFRMDAVNMIEPAFWQRFNRDIKDEAGRNFFILGECYDVYPEILNLYAPYFDAFFDFNTSLKMRKVITHRSPVSALSKAMMQRRKIYENHILMIPFVDNHDVSRFLTYTHTDSKQAEKQLEQALIFLFTQPDSPYLLYGIESGVTDADAFRNTNYDSSRNTMKFNPQDPAGILIKKLIILRKRLNIARGDLKVISKKGDILAYYIHVPETNKEIYVVHNFGKEHASYSLPNENQGKHLQLTDLLTGKVIRSEKNNKISVSLDNAASRILYVEQ